MPLSPERRRTMRVFAETALRIGQTVPVGPRTLLDMLDEIERPRHVAIRTVEALDSLPEDATLATYGKGGVVDIYQRILMDTGGLEWHTPGVRRAIPSSEVPLPATLVFIPKRG